MSLFVNVLTAVFVVVGVALALVAAIGLHRLGDTRARMHAATKPATLGVLCCATGAVLQVDDVSSITKVVVVVVLQVITAPVGAHMLSRAITIDADQAG
ncbi:MAG: monovalent cation/H(+) antiporter subunit G [Ilumatobacteraceae bacterium]